MPTIYKKILNQGMSNPIVARTIAQSEVFMNAFPITDELKARVFSIYLRFCKRLLAMQDFASWLERECQSIESDFIANGLKKIGEDVVEAPQVIDLDSRAESFLQSAKLCISDIGQLFGSLVSTDFDHKFHKVVGWAEEHFGEDNEHTKWLVAQELWIKDVLEMRNALEHPKNELRGRLHIDNIEFAYTENGISGKAPQWYLTGEPPTAIAIDSKNLVNKLLVVSEDILASTLEKLFPEVPVMVRVIPEENRDPKCPIRLELAPRFIFD